MKELVLPDSLLDRLADEIEVPERSKFRKLGEGSYFCIEPLCIEEKAKEEVESFAEIAPVGCTIKTLNFPETFKLIKKINDGNRLNNKIRLGTSEENLRAFRLDQDYRHNVLGRHSVWTGEIARPSEDAYLIKEVAYVPNVKVAPLQVQSLVDEKGQPITALVSPKIKIDQIQYIAEKSLSKKIPTFSNSHLRDFSVIPSDEDIDWKGDVEWSGASYSPDGFGAMICYAMLWDGGKKVLNYQLVNPLTRHNNKAIPIFASSLK
jgi:hypothetical protein